MSRELFARAKEIFLAVCEAAPELRPEMLDEACGDDPSLRAEVERLLGHHHQVTVDATTFHSASTTGPAATSEGPRFETGDVFAERYRIIDCLGSGGMGVVYRAHDLLVNEPVALKLLHRLRRGRGDGLLDEVRLARQVSHANVCRVFDVAEADGEIYLTMEYVEGDDLASLLKRIGRLPPDKLDDVARQLSAGVAAAHARGVLHRDLKPANVMIDREGRVKITDFGIAVPVGERDHGSVAGTPAYMAPEQLEGAGSSAQSDLYSLGLLLHEAATGRRVYRGSTLAEIAQHRAAAPPAPLLEVAPQVSPPLAAVVDRCLSTEPGRRPTSALTVAAALPGADPISLALDIGQTPSPDQVAAAGDRSTPALGGPLLPLVLLLGLLACALTLGDRASPAASPDEIKPPAVLAERADVLLRSLAHPPPGDRAWGFLPASGPATGAESHLFWYREAADHLVVDSAWNLTLGNGRVDLFDPAPIEPGMVQLILDSSGRLVQLDAVPENDELPQVTGSTNWSSALEAAGLTGHELSEVTPRRVPLAHADELVAWTATTTDGRSIRFDGAALGGLVIDVAADLESPGTAAHEGAAEQRLVTEGVILDLLLVVIVLTAAVAARRSILRGHGDPLGARRLALTVVIARVAHWLLAADHAPVLESELTALELTLGAALLEGVFVWLGYMALEPLVRRSWPRTLVAWSRLLRGRVRNPAVGRSLLIGTASGALWAVAGQLDLVLTNTLGLPIGPLVDPGFALDVALNGRLPVANLLEVGVLALEGGIAALFALALVRTATGRQGWSLAVLFAGFALLRSFDGAHPAVSWPLLGLVVAGTAVVVLVRFGLLAFVVARCAEELLLGSPLTLDLDAWFAGSGLFAVAVVAAVGVLGRHFSSAREPAQSTA